MGFVEDVVGGDTDGDRGSYRGECSLAEGDRGCYRGECSLERGFIGECCRWLY